MVLHRHWIAIVGKVAVGGILLLLPFIALPLTGFLPHISVSLVGATLFFFVIYILIVFLILFIFWIEYYLDVWIITTERIIDIEQKSLFNREISEFRIQNVQDVTIDIPGMLATFLKYGNMTIQTAGERSFTIHDVPNLYEAKNLILDYSKNKPL